jgi:hypothetical protein
MQIDPLFFADNKLLLQHGYRNRSKRCPCKPQADHIDRKAATHSSNRYRSNLAGRSRY